MTMRNSKGDEQVRSSLSIRYKGKAAALTAKLAGLKCLRPLKSRGRSRYEVLGETEPAELEICEDRMVVTTLPRSMSAQARSRTLLLALSLAAYLRDECTFDLGDTYPAVIEALLSVARRKTDDHADEALIRQVRSLGEINSDLSIKVVSMLDREKTMEEQVLLLVRFAGIALRRAIQEHGFKNELEALRGLGLDDDSARKVYGLLTRAYANPEGA